MRLTLILMLVFCASLSTTSFASQSVDGKEAAEIIIKGKILNKGFHDGWFNYSVEYKGRLYFCIQTNSGRVMCNTK